MPDTRPDPLTTHRPFADTDSDYDFLSMWLACTCGWRADHDNAPDNGSDEWAKHIAGVALTQPQPQPEDGLREALEREHYFHNRLHDPEYVHGHPWPIPDGKWCGVCASKSECVTCAALRSTPATPKEDDRG